MRNRINGKGFISDLYNQPNSLVIDTSPSISGGFKVGNKKVIPDNIVWIEDVNDFPEKNEQNIISLEPNKKYIITNQIELGSASFFVPDNVTFMGFDRNSTGLITALSGAALFSGSNGINISNLNLCTVPGSTIFDVSTNTSNEEIVLHSNKYTSSSIGRIGSAKNVEITFSTLDSCFNGFQFFGEYGTITFDSVDIFNPKENFIFSEILSGAIINDRVRTVFCRLDIVENTIGFSASTDITIGNDSYQLFGNYFTGSGDYTTGLTVDSDAAFFRNNIGVRDSNAVANMTMRGNTTLTPLTNNIWAKALGGTTGSSGEFLNKFIHQANNRLIYTGKRNRTFRADVLASLNGAVGVDFTLAIFKNQQLISASAFPISTDGNGNFRNVSILANFVMETNDYVEFYIRNDFNNSDVTVTTMNFNLIEV